MIQPTEYVGEVEAGPGRSAGRIAVALPPAEVRPDAGTDPRGALRFSCSQRVGLRLLGDVQRLSG